MKCIFVSPIKFIQDAAICPAIPMLMGILKENGIEAEYKDLNFEFNKNFLDSNFINEYISYYEKILDKDDYSPFLKTLIAEIKPLWKTSLSYIRNLSISNNFLLTMMNDKSFFYNIVLSEYVKEETAYLPNFAKIFSNFGEQKTIQNGLNYSQEETLVDLDHLLEFCKSDLNFYIDKFYDEFIDGLIKSEGEKPQYIGIQITFADDLFLGLFLAYKIKQRTNIHVNIGGSFFDIYKIKNLNNLFDGFIDSISIKDNTSTIVEICKYIENKIPIENVPNIIYKKDDKICTNSSFEEKDFLDLPYFDFTGYKRENYFNNEFVLPMRITNSCYWRKCIFCNEHSMKPYKIRPVERVVDELEYLSKKYNTRFFIFWDSAISPEYMRKLSQKLIEKKLNISYSIYARFEKEFNVKLLKQMKKSGCLCICWGLDSCSDRVLKYINKGVTTENQSTVLKNSYKAGIFNFACLILGHPTETEEDLQKNIDFIEKHKKYINYLNLIEELLYKPGSIITENKETCQKAQLSPNVIKSYARKIKKIKNLNTHKLSVSFSPYLINHIKHIGIKRVQSGMSLVKFLKKHKKLFKIYKTFYCLKYTIKHGLKIKDTVKILKLR